MAPAPAMEPVDGSSVVVYERRAGRVHLLMGQRHKTQAFMPDRFVFPRGRVDPGDAAISFAAGLPARLRDLLLLEMVAPPAPERAQAIAVAAVRELYEEAGLIVGAPGAAALPASASLAGARPDGPDLPWPQFRAHGFEPAVAPLCYFARAITPPGRTRRFDTRFFSIERGAISCETGTVDGELKHLDWYPADDLQTLNLAPITKVIIREFLDHLDGGPEHPVPFYHQADGIFRRDVLAIKGCQRA